jgi:hypothetical protein
MDSKLKSVPLTLLDFMGILLPGLIWLMLLVITLQIVVDKESPIINSPLDALANAASRRGAEIAWTPIVLAIVAAALLIGYAVKPIAMRLAALVAFVFLKRQKKFRKVRFRRLNYPFKHFYKKSECHRKVYSFIRKELQCSPYRLPGSQPFTAAKRYIRLTAPALWEESERMEAEVRMTGALLLASVYSLVLSVTVLLLQLFGRLPDTRLNNTWAWIAFSFIATVVLAESFNYLRFREVGYTYVNFMIASRFRVPDSVIRSDGKAE